MTQSRLFQILTASTGLAFTACAADEGPNAETASADGTRIHMMPIHNSADGAVANAITPQIAGLTYFGGPVLTHVDVHPVFWNSATKLQSNINAFYPAVIGPSSTVYTSLLPQYTNASGTAIGTGTAVAGIVDTKSTASVTDAAVQTELNRLFSAGLLPLPNSQRYYPVHFPSGMTITAPDGSRSCVVFCAYHGTYVRSGVNVNYGVIPDIGQSGCNGGCGGSTVLNNTTSVSSHELVEATTDPAVGLATTFAAPLAWYDRTDNGEIGDLCNGQQSTDAGFTVQKEWSNASHACKTTR